MPKDRACANDIGLPRETLFEVHDGISLAMDALNARQPLSTHVNEALGHLRYAMRSARQICEVS